jgi:hypothetical protein
LPPQLLNYKGRALVIDPDVFATRGTEVMDLLEKDMGGKAIMACSAGENKWRSSVMLLDCEKLPHWRWEENLAEIFSGKKDYRAWMNLQLEPDGSIGTLGNEWNSCDLLNSQTKFIHYTRRLTQPWKTGLKIDFKYDPGQSRYKFIPQPILRSLKSLLKRGDDYHLRYQKNPDNLQEQFFFSLVNEAIRAGYLNFEMIEEQIAHKNLRKDFFRFVEKDLKA